MRPDGFYPTNGIMTAFAILMVIWQGIDWLAEKKLFSGLVAILLPLAWPFLASLLMIQFPALSTPLGFLCYSFVPIWGVTGDSSWPVLAMGLVLYLFRKNRKVQVAAFCGRTENRPSCDSGTG